VDRPSYAASYRATADAIYDAHQAEAAESAGWEPRDGDACSGDDVVDGRGRSSTESAERQAYQVHCRALIEAETKDAHWSRDSGQPTLRQPLACGRRMESAWSNGRPAYRCRHGHTSASAPSPERRKTAYVREDRIVPHLPALHLLLTAPSGEPRRRRRTRRGIDVRHQAAEEVIAYLREQQITLAYDPAQATLRADTGDAAQAITLKAS
jgi:hypothetical protein